MFRDDIEVYISTVRLLVFLKFFNVVFVAPQEKMKINAQIRGCS